MAGSINDDNVQHFFTQKKTEFFLLTFVIWLFWSLRNCFIFPK